jgi:two-component system response regulator NreC
MLSPPQGTSVLRMSMPAHHPVPAGAPDSLPATGAVVTIGADDAARGSITIVLADDHQVVRSGLRMLLEAEDGFEVLGEAGNVSAALQEVFEHRPHVLVLDLNMSGESSLSAIPRLRRESPATQVVVLTMQDELAFAREALRAGALGYVLKDAADAELVRAVRSAAQGETYLNPRLRSRLMAEPLRPVGAPDHLSPRELEVLKLIALGHTNGEIASTLYLSVRTVESHRAHIQQKTGRTTRAELVGYALENELLA